MYKTRLIAMFALVVFFGVSAAWAAKSASFVIPFEVKLNGTTLKRGTYKIEVEGETATIRQGKKQVAEAKVTVRPLADGEIRKSSLIDASGNLRQVMIKDEVVVFSN